MSSKPKVLRCGACGHPVLEGQARQSVANTHRGFIQEFHADYQDCALAEQRQSAGDAKVPGLPVSWSATAGEWDNTDTLG